MEKEELEPKYKKRVEEIEERIKGLKEHQTMWRKAGGVGPRMALDAQREISELESEKRRILSGLQQHIDSVKETKETLELLKKKNSILKRNKYSKEIKKLDKELDELRMSK